MSDIINWLLEDDTPEIKYRTMLDLLNMPKEHPEVQKALNILIHSEVVKAAIEKFKNEKKWDDYNSLCTLAEFGLTRNDIEIDSYTERLINTTGFKMMCGEGLLLRNLVALGYYDYSKVQQEIPLAFSALKQDGGFQCISKNKKINDPKLPHKSCYRLTATYLLLAAQLKIAGVNAPQCEKIANYFLNREVLFRHDDANKIVVEESAGTFYPLDPVKTGLQMILYGLSVLGYGNNPGCKKAWELLDSKKDSLGRYNLDKALTKPYFKIGKVGKPNKWVTLYALLAKKNITAAESQMS